MRPWNSTLAKAHCKESRNHNIYRCILSLSPCLSCCHFLLWLLNEEMPWCSGACLCFLGLPFCFTQYHCIQQMLWTRVTLIFCFHVIVLYLCQSLESPFVHEKVHIDYEMWYFRNAVRGCMPWIEDRQNIWLWNREVTMHISTLSWKPKGPQNFCSSNNHEEIKCDHFCALRLTNFQVHLKFNNYVLECLWHE